MMTAPLLLDPEDTEAVLSAALRDALGAGARLEDWASDDEFTQHGKRRVVRYSVHARAAQAAEVEHYEWVGKFYEHDEDARRVAAVMQQLADSDCCARAGVVVPRVLRYHPPRHLLLLTYEAGASVSSAIAQDTARVLAGMGRALAALHAAPVTLDVIRPPAAVLEELRPKIALLCVRLRDEAAALQDSLAQLERDMPLLPAKRTFVHGDFGPANLLWRAGHIVILDFDRCTHGDPALDLGNLLAQLFRMSVRKPAKLPDFATARRDLLAAYQRSAPADPELEQRVAWYERATLLRKVYRLAFIATPAEAARLFRASTSDAA